MISLGSLVRLVRFESSPVAVHALQGFVKVNQPGGLRKFESPNWDRTRLNNVRDALLVLAAILKDFRGGVSKKGEVDPIRHLIGAAAAWGATPMNRPRHEPSDCQRSIAGTFPMSTHMGRELLTLPVAVAATTALGGGGGGGAETIARQATIGRRGRWRSYPRN